MKKLGRILGTFKPGNPITRGQAAAIIAKLTNLDMTNVKGQTLVLANQS